MPITEEIKQSVLAYERRFMFMGCVDLIALFDSLKEHPDQARLFIETRREIRRESRITRIC